MSELEDPWALLRRLKLGREEFCQRLLTQLILESPYPRWNTRSVPSERGSRFLQRLDEMSFGSAAPMTDAVFIDEFDLPSRDGDEVACAPDYAVLTESRLWIIELKTEAASHRAGQVPSYFSYARHHYPAHQIHLTYISPPFRGTPVQAPEGSRFAHLTWDEVIPLVTDVWDGSDGVPQSLAEALRQVLDESDTKWQAWRSARIEDPVASGVSLGRRTAMDGQQRALDHPFAGIEELERARVQLRDALADEGLDSRPWVWRAATSGGTAMTATGAECGYELRLSRYLSRGTSNPMM